MAEKNRNVGLITSPRSALHILSSISRKIFSFRESGILFSLIVLVIVLNFANANFLTKFNITTLILGMTFLSLVALGETLVLIGGGIDLSVGAIAGLSGIAAAWLMVNSGIPPLVCLLIAIFIGSACGLFNALLITRLKIHPLIITLGTGEIFYGLVLIWTKGLAIVRIPSSIYFLGQPTVFGIPFPTIVLVVALIVLHFILVKTALGRRIFVLGGSEQTANLLGIRPNTLKFFIYSVAGAFSAMAGVLMVARLTSGQPTIGQYWLLPAIGAAVIGGTSLFGGEGTLFGTLIGATIMKILENATVLLGISAYAERAVVGSVIILAVFMDFMRRKEASI